MVLSFSGKVLRLRGCQVASMEFSVRLRLSPAQSTSRDKRPLNDHPHMVIGDTLSVFTFHGFAFSVCLSWQSPSVQVVQGVDQYFG